MCPVNLLSVVCKSPIDGKLSTSSQKPYNFRLAGIANSIRKCSVIDRSVCGSIAYSSDITCIGSLSRSRAHCKVKWIKYFVVWRCQKTCLTTLVLFLMSREPISNVAKVRCFRSLQEDFYGQMRVNPVGYWRCYVSLPNEVQLRQLLWENEKIRREVGFFGRHKIQSYRHVVRFLR